MVLSHLGSSPTLQSDGLLVGELSDTNDAALFEFVDATTARLTINGQAYDYDRAAIWGVSLDGGDGDDLLQAAPDVDLPLWLAGGSGNDTLVSAAGVDELDAGPGLDSLSAGASDDRLFAKFGDALDSGAGADEVSILVAGTDANDMIVVEMPNPDTIRVQFNGTSYDYARTELNALTVDAAGGDDSVSVASDMTLAVALVGGAGADTLVGGAGDDSLDGGTGPDSMRGSDGADRLFVDLTDTVSGGDGVDEWVVFVPGSDATDQIDLTYVDALTARLVVNGVSYDLCAST